MVKILDCTIRDGGNITNWVFDKGYVIELMYQLEKKGVEYFEIGYRNHYDTEGKGDFYKCNPEFLKEFYLIKNKLKIGVMTDYKRYSSEDFPGVDNDYIDFLRIATHPDKIKDTLNIAENMHEKGYKIFLQLMDVSNIDIEGYIALFEWKNKSVIESLYIADSYGTLRPEDIKKYYDKLKMLGYKNISFHGHNNLGFAVANSLEAVKNGAYSIDGTQNGIGRCGGNSDIQELLANI